MPKISRVRAVVLAALTLRIFTACSEDEAPPAPLPEGPPDLHIASFDAPGRHTAINDAGEGACFSVGEASSRACDSSVSGPGCGFVVVLRTNATKQIPLELPDGSLPRSWSFQAPLGCNGAPDCGYALLLIDPTSPPCAARPEAKVQQVAAGPVISVDFEDLQRGLNGSFGRTTVRVELWPGEGVPDKDHCHFTEASVDFQLSCGATDGGATEAGPDARSPDGAPTEAGKDAPSDGPAEAGKPDASVDGAAPSDGGAGKDASDAATPGDGSVDARSDGG